MPLFKYSGRDRQGNAVTGVVEAAAPDKLAEQLLRTGITPTKIVPEKAAKNVEDMFSGMSKVKIKPMDKIFFSRQMYTMLKAGVPILQALQGLGEATVNPSLREVLKSMQSSLNAGSDLSSAAAKHPNVFSRLYINMIGVGEGTGSLPDVFKSMADFLQKEHDTISKVKGAMKYPMTVIVAITIAMFIVNIKVIPAFSTIFAKLGSDLPFATQILVSSSKVFKGYWMHMIGVAVVSTFAFKSYLKTSGGREHWDAVKLRLPLVGKILMGATLARFSRALALTIKSGVPIVQALPMVARAVDNSYLESRIQRMQDKISAGGSIALAAEDTGLFPPLVLQMIRIGEETGELEALIEEVAMFYEREVDHMVENIGSAIEPVLLLVVGGMVLLLALGIFGPMWGLMDAAKKR